MCKLNRSIFTYLCGISFFFFTCFSVVAQNDSLPSPKKNRGHLLFAAGLSEPLGDLASHDYTKSYTGRANTGLALQFSYNQPISRYLGICAAFHRESFFMDEEELTKINQTKLPPGYTIQVELNQNWSVSGLQAGIFGSIPLYSDKRLFFEPRIMFGLCRGKSPGMTFTIDSIVPQNEPIYTETQLSTKSSNIPGSFLIGVGLRYNTPANWCFTLQLDYLDLLSETEFTDILFTNSLNQTANGKAKIDMQYYTVKLGIGKLISR